jgi:hypothetical protein
MSKPILCECGHDIEVHADDTTTQCLELVFEDVFCACQNFVVKAKEPTPSDSPPSAKLRGVCEMPIKIYAINDCDWWGTEGTAEDARREYLKMFGGDVSVTDDPPVQITDADMDRLTFDWGETRDRKTFITFREALDRMLKEGVKFPALFASTEY